MARIQTWFNQDLNEAVKVRYIDGNVFSADNNGNVIGVNVFDGGEPAALTGTVSANIIRADGATVAAAGTLSGNQVSVALPQSAYAVPGVLSVILKVTSGTDVTTVLAVVGNVYKSTTDTVVDPGTIIPDISTLVAEIEAAIASIPADYSTLWTCLAPAFSTSTAYKIGQYVTYDGGLYRFTSAHPAGTWNSSHVTSIALGTDLYEVRDDAIMRLSSVSSSGTYATLADYPDNKRTQVTAAVMQGYSDRPDTSSASGAVVCTFAGSKTGTARVQVVTYLNGKTYIRVKTTSGWRAWTSPISEISSESPTTGTYNSLSEYPDNMTYQVGGAVMQEYSDAPNLIDDDFGGAIVTTVRGSSAGSYKYQTVVYTNGITYIRFYTGTAWTAWNCLSLSSGVITSATENLTALGDIVPNSIIAFSTSVFNAFSDKPYVATTSAIVETFTPFTANSYGKYQRVIDYSGNFFCVRVYKSSGWGDWTVFRSATYQSPGDIMSELVLAGTQKNVVLLGDSITQGTGTTGFVSYDNVRGNGPDYPDAGPGYQVGQYIYTVGDNVRIFYEALSGHGWAQLIKAYFESKFNCVVRNFGMAGANSGHLLAYLSQTTYPLTGFDIAVVMIGTNDRYESASITKAKSYSNICDIVDKLRSNGQQVVLMAPIPATLTDEEKPSRLYHMEDVKHIVLKVAEDKNVPLVSLYDMLKDYCLYTGTSLSSLMNSDGLHPNDTGHEVLLKLICKGLGLSYPIDGFTW